MFHVFYLRPEAKKEVLSGAIVRSGAYFSAVLLVAAWFYFMEPETFESKRIFIAALCFFFTLVAILVGTRHYKLGRDFRLFSNEDGFEFTTPGAQVKLAYNDITRVERTPKNLLLIYTQSSASKPVVMISTHITDRDILEQILVKYVPITDGPGLPFLFNTTAQLIISTLFIITILVQFITTHVVTAVVSGLGVIGILVYSAIIMYTFQKEVKNTRAMIALTLLVAVVIARIVLFLFSDQS